MPTNYGETLARKVDQRIAASPADQTALQNIPADQRADGQMAMVEADQTVWQYVAASSASSLAGQVIIPADNPATGRWLAGNGASVANLASTAGGKGAALVGVQDAAGRLNSSTTVEAALASLGARIAIQAANPTAIAAIPAAARTDGQLAVDLSTGYLWRFSAASIATDATFNLAIAPAAGSGAWLRQAGAVDLKLAIGTATADAAVLYTVPAGFKLRIQRAYHEVVTSFTGGSSSAIGVSSSNENFNTAGDILGGAGGDVAATLVSTGSPYKGGTLGTKFGSNGIVVLVAGDTVKFNRIVDHFTAGAGFVHIQAEIIG